MIKYIIALLIILQTSFTTYAQQENIPQKLFSFVNRMDETKNLDSMKSIYAQMQKLYPEANHKDMVNIYSIVKLKLAIAMIKARDPLSNEMISSIPAGDIRRTFFGSIIDQLIKLDQITYAETLLKNELALGKKDSTAYYAYSYNYADLLYQLKRYKEALQWIAPIDEAVGLNSAPKKALYAFILYENKNYSKAVEILSEIVKQGRASDQAKRVLKEAWIASGKEAANFDSYLKGLAERLSTNKTEEMKKLEVNYDAPDFKLLNLEGKEVSLSSFKNKVVMLDFWATWCGPCVASFPAMQKGINKYKDNKDVVFLFINTLEQNSETITRETKIKEFMKDKPFKFNVLLDPKVASGRDQYEVVTKYNVKGIPAKFIIDRKGKVRYALVGFSGGDDEAVEELSIAIDKLLKE